ncbi:TatD family hydrolase [Paraglaciecola sp. 2405UD69-4]|uniref:TatD family hydrolase n=1 Tax=Paraglaciecola sp. 2405UD69-4 TaxID=3391836 RepID=UPI0039C97191
MFIDSHCHIDFSEFDLDRADVIKQCNKLGISKLIVPGTRLAYFERQLSLANAFPSIRNAFGLHPYFLDSYQNSHLKKLENSIEKNLETLVALGEIGLDKAISIDWKLQLKVFQVQVEIAAHFELPIILHHRKSHNEIIQILKQSQLKYGGIVHAFSGSLQVAEAYVELGFAIGVGGGITYPRANKTRNAIQQIPVSSIVLETDAPDMPIHGYQGLRNSPLKLPLVFDALTKLREESKEELQEACFKNVHNHLINV